MSGGPRKRRPRVVGYRKVKLPGRVGSGLVGMCEVVLGSMKGRVRVVVVGGARDEGRCGNVGWIGRGVAFVGW